MRRKLLRDIIDGGKTEEAGAKANHFLINAINQLGGLSLSFVSFIQHYYTAIDFANPRHKSQKHIYVPANDTATWAW